MRKFETLLMCIALIAITSCSNKNAPSDDDASKNPLGREVTDAEKRGMRLLKSRQESKKNMTTDKSQNKTSAYRYLISSDEYPIFTNLVKKSRMNKHIHSGDVTVLAPVDSAFNDYPNYKDLMLPGNEELLDEFISYHVVDESMEYKQFSDGVNWTVHAGPTLSLTNKGGIHFGGAHVRSGSIETDLGTIIGMDDLIYFPEFEK